MSTGLSVYAQKEILLDKDRQSFLVDILYNPSFSVVDYKIAKANTDEIGGLFIQNPETNNIKDELRSGLIDYSPEKKENSSKFFLFNSVTDVAKNIYKLEVEQTNQPVP